MKVGIIGLGFVGSAVKSAYDNVNIQTVCNDPAKGINASHEEMSNTDAIFICVPSPQAADGSCDTSILEEVLNQYKDIYSALKKQVKTLKRIDRLTCKVSLKSISCSHIMCFSNILSIVNLLKELFQNQNNMKQKLGQLLILEHSKTYKPQ